MNRAMLLQVAQETTPKEARCSMTGVKDNFAVKLGCYVYHMRAEL